MELIILAAASENNIIGNNGDIPWRIPEDMKRFRKLTLNYSMIMGRKTFESIGRVLDNRRNIVLSRNFNHDGVIVTDSIEEAFKQAREYSDKAFIIGGQIIYEQTIDLADRLELTRVKGNYKGDRFFPEINYDKWMEVGREDKEGYSFLSYARKNA